MRASRMVDIHCHILPGIDDGPATIEESLRIAGLLVEQGVDTVVATPHVGSRRWPVTAARVRSTVAGLQDACRGLGLTVLPGCDAALQPDLLAMLDAGELLTVADTGAYLLLELPAQALPRIEGLVSELVERGTTPVLTHPERNPEFLRRPDRLAELVACGCLVQLTAGSFTGEFGTGARRAAEFFLEQGLAHVVASDAHAPSGRRAPCLDRAFDRVADLDSEDAAVALFEDTPRRIVTGRPVFAGVGAQFVADRPVGRTASCRRGGPSHGTDSFQPTHVPSSAANRARTR